MKFYEDDFEKATSWFEKDIGALIRVLYSRGKPEKIGQPAITSQVKELGGWFGG